MRARGQLWTGLAAATLLLAGCGSMIYGPSSQQRKQAQQQAAAGSAGSQAAQVQTQATAASSKAPPSKKSELEPAVIDIVTVFQDKLREKPEGYDVKDVAGSSQGIGQLMLVTTGMKLNRSPQQDRIFYVISGRGDIMLDGNASQIRAGHIIVVPLGVAFSVTPSGEQPLRLLALKSPGNGHNALEWVKDGGGTEPETTDETSSSANMAESSSESSEEFQTGTLNQAPDEGANDVQGGVQADPQPGIPVGDNQTGDGGYQQ